MRARIRTNKFSQKDLQLKIFSSKENNFYTVHFLSKIMAHLVLIMFYFFSKFLVIFIHNKILFYMLSMHTLKNRVMLYFL